MASSAAVAPAGASLPSWEAVALAGEGWAAPRRPRPGDVPLQLYRDANAWCPFCHRVWWFLEEKGLRYTTERIHLRGDPAEPPKQASYKRLVPSGSVPAVRIGDEIVPESLDILFRLEDEFPEPRMLPAGDEEHARRLCETSMAFNTDGSEWLHNRRPEDEDELREDFLGRLRWLEGALAARGGPFFLGKRPSLVDAAYVGFLSRCAHNFLYFKNLDVRDPAERPRLAAWFEAMEGLPSFQVTKQDAFFEQRIYQAHPDRRAGAEPCMQLGRAGSCVGEPDCRVQPALPAAPLAIGSQAALEAASRLAERRGPLTQFLLRKRGGAAARGDADDAAAVELQLLALASALAGLVPAEAAARAAGGAAALAQGPVGRLGELIGTPRDMSSAAAAQVRAALAAMALEGCGAAAAWAAVD